MKKVVVDIETDSLDATRVWIVGTHELISDTKDVFKLPDIRKGERDRLATLLDGAEVIMHNGIGFDQGVLSKLLSIHVPDEYLFDTLVAGRLVCYNTVKSHGLAVIGEHFGYPKPSIEDFTVGCTPEMVERVQADVGITVKWYRHICNMMHQQGGIESWLPALRLEFETQRILEQFKKDGFFFDVPRAHELREKILKRVNELEEAFQEDWPPQLQVVNTIKYRLTQKGNEFASVVKARGTYPKTEIDGDDFLCYDYVPFNPKSSKDRVVKLWEAGWKPTIKTDGHYKWDRMRREDKTSPKEVARGENFKKYGWTCDEENLLTLPGNAPASAHRLAEWLTLNGRLSNLDQWLGCVDPEDSRIHGSFIGLGSWTQRLAHMNPNQANIFAPFHGDANSPVKKVKKEYDSLLRSLWCVPEGKVQIGCDADGIQLRLLAHFMKSEMYRDAILSGKKEEGTDIHNLNRVALGLPHITRDMAKTFVIGRL